MKYYGNELYHWGIKGQKWGTRNYQNEDGSYTDKGQRENEGLGRYSRNTEREYFQTKNSKKKYTNKVKKTNNRITKEPSKTVKSEKEGFSLTENQKKALKIAAIAAGTAIVAYGGYKLAVALNDDGSVKMIQGNHTWLQDLKAVNPGNLSHFQKQFMKDAYSTKNDTALIPGSDENCTIGAAVYDLRRRGYDVSAGLYNGGVQLSSINEVFYNGKGKIFGQLSLSDIQKKLDTMPEGARGIISFSYKDSVDAGLAHSIPWEVTKDGLKIIDTEINQVYGNTVNDLKKAFTIPGQKISQSLINNGHTASFMRTDTIKDINEKIFDPKYITTTEAKNKMTKGLVKYVANANDMTFSECIENDPGIVKEMKDVISEQISGSNKQGFVTTVNDVKLYADHGKEVLSNVIKIINN